ncbi:MAG: hypothetical protein GXX85_09640 [Ignavibacteria bacterium]|nr:hypothetical protein [Ignavibacteria bacterium]
MTKIKIFKVIFLFAIYVSMFSGIVSSQQIYFCYNVTDKGDPVNPIEEITLRQGPEYFHILLKNQKELRELVYLYIEIKDGNKYEPLESKVLRNINELNFVKYNYRFINSGEYRITFKTPERRKIAEAKINVKQAAFEKGNEVEVSSTYYEDTQIIICERIIDEKPIDFIKYARLSRNDGFIYVYIKADKPLNTKYILSDIWQKKDNTSEFTEFVSSKKLKTNKEWEYTFFKVKLPQKGEYKITLYNDNKKIINSAYIIATD